MSEKPCGIYHDDVQEAIDQAYTGLVQGQKRLFSQPYCGTRGGNLANAGKIIGWRDTGPQEAVAAGLIPREGRAYQRRRFHLAD